ncbi:hypothetical protein LCGC14_0264630 [marine sediment metagenome]|uniref:Uncharacterized protein n=1 Tax=marine sediment metagenome TaxID=412755 RepID=A0A0F9U100_9ZZZZ
MTRALYVEVEGDPKSKGSMLGFVVGKGKSARAIVTHSQQSKDWEAIIRQHLGDARALDGPVSVELWFFLKRPKSVKDRPYPSVPPDIDKLTRATLDAIKGTIEDDSRVVDLDVRKRYAEDYGVAPGVMIYVQETFDGRIEERSIFDLIRKQRLEDV